MLSPLIACMEETVNLFIYSILFCYDRLVTFRCKSLVAEGEYTSAFGLGMGLAISRSIIQAHHGRIWTSSSTWMTAVIGSGSLPAA